MTRSRELAELATAYDTGTPLGFRNRLINSDMRIDQRNAGATVNTDLAFPLDRWKAFRNGGAATFTSQRSTVAPDNATNSLLYTVGTGAAPGASDYSGLSHTIEGFNIADLGWGTASAKPVTMSFKVRSSVTGSFGVSFRNSASNRSYIASFTIAAANTWETKTITVPGDTTGTWLTDNGAGLVVLFDLGVGSTFSDTAGSWLAANKFGLTGGTKLIATSGATFHVTEVQLEAGSVATPFERRPYGTELQLCQRYACSTFPQGVAWGQNRGFNGSITVMSQNTSARQLGYFTFPVTMRSTPSVVTTYSPFATSAQWWNDSAGQAQGDATIVASAGDRGRGVFTTSNAGVVSNVYLIHMSAEAEL
jgi:hypothetical protein